MARRIRVVKPDMSVRELLESVDLDRGECVVDLGDDRRIGIVPAWRLETEDRELRRLLAKARERGVPEERAETLAKEAVRAVRRDSVRPAKHRPDQ